MADVSVKQSKSNVAAKSGAAAVTITTPISGNALVVLAYANDSTATPTCTDSNSNTYVQHRTDADSGSGASWVFRRIADATEGTTITVDWSVSVNAVVCVGEYASVGTFDTDFFGAETYTDQIGNTGSTYTADDSGGADFSIAFWGTGAGDGFSSFNWTEGTQVKSGNAVAGALANNDTAGNATVTGSKSGDYTAYNLELLPGPIAYSQSFSESINVVEPEYVKGGTAGEVITRAFTERIRSSEVAPASGLVDNFDGTWDGSLNSGLGGQSFTGDGREIQAIQLRVLPGTEAAAGDDLTAIRIWTHTGTYGTTSDWTTPELSVYTDISSDKYPGVGSEGWVTSLPSTTPFLTVNGTNYMLRFTIAASGANLLVRRDSGPSPNPVHDGNAVNNDVVAAATDVGFRLIADWADVVVEASGGTDFVEAFTESIDVTEATVLERDVNVTEIADAVETTAIERDVNTAAEIANVTEVSDAVKGLISSTTETADATEAIAIAYDVAVTESINVSEAQTSVAVMERSFSETADVTEALAIDRVIQTVTEKAMSYERGAPIDVYGQGNESALQLLGLSSSMGQSFTGDGSTIYALKVFANRNANPTGAMVADIFDHAGVFGTSSVPTGATLATSNSVPVAEIPSIQDGVAQHWITLVFPSPFTTVAGTNYCWELSGVSGSIGNRINVFGDDTTLAHPGNSFVDGVADASEDFIFEIIGIQAIIDRTLQRDETADVTEAVIEAHTIRREFTENADATEAIALGRDIADTETIDVTEAEVIASGTQVEFTESIDVTEAPAIAYDVAVTESIGVSEAQAIVGVFERSATETADVTEALAIDRVIVPRIEIAAATERGAPIDVYGTGNHVSSVNILGFSLTMGQSFTGDGSKIEALKIWANRNNAPTGSIVCDIFDHSGVFGTSSLPTGATLATSDSIPVDDVLSAQDGYTASWVVLRFPTPFETVAGTNYCWELSGVSGSIGNRINVAKDVTSPTHGGNSFVDGVADAAEDFIFEIIGIPAIIDRTLQRDEIANATEAAAIGFDVTSTETADATEAAVLGRDVNVTELIDVQEPAPDVVEGGGSAFVEAFTEIANATEAAVLDRDVNATETVNVTETSDVSEGQSEAFTEIADATESAALERDVNATEIANATEAAVFARDVNATEIANVTEASALARDVNATEVSNVTESSEVSEGQQEDFTEVANVTESSAVSEGQSVAFTEVADATEAIQIARDRNVTEIANVTETSAVVESGAFVEAFTESIDVTEADALARDINTTETANVTEADTEVVGRTASATETADATESVALARDVNATEVANVTETTEISYDVAATETVNVTEAAALARDLHATETADATESDADVVGRVASATEVADATEAAVLDRDVNATEVANVTETSAVVESGAFVEAFTENADVAESSALERDVNATEAADVTEVEADVVGRVASATEVADVTEAAVLDRDVNATEIADVTETSAVVQSGVFVEAFTETADVTEQVDVVHDHVVEDSSFTTRLKSLSPGGHDVHHWWKLDESSGATITDHGKGLEDGTYSDPGTGSGLGASTIVTGEETALQLEDESNETVQSGSNTSWQWQTSNLDDWTYGAWFNLDDFSAVTDQFLFFRQATVRITIADDGTLTATRTTSVPAEITVQTAAGAITAGTNHFVMITFETATGEGFKLYLDGEFIDQAASLQTQNSPGNRVFFIGTETDVSGELFNGRIQHVFFFVGPNDGAAALTLSDHIFLWSGGVAEISAPRERIDVTETSDSLKGLSASATEVTNVTEAIDIVSGTEIAVTESINVTEQTVFARTLVREETIDVTEISDVVDAGNAVEAFTEVVNVSESIAIEVSYTFQEAIDVIESTVLDRTLVFEEDIDVTEEFQQSSVSYIETIEVFESIAVLKVTIGAQQVSLFGRSGTIGLRGRAGTIEPQGEAGTIQIRGKAP